LSENNENNNNNNNNNNDRTDRNNIDPARQPEPENSGSNNSRSDDEGYDDGSSSTQENLQSTPERWILLVALATLGLGVILLTLRSVIFSLVFVTIGISLFAYWLYLGVRSREQAHYFPGYFSSGSTFTKSGATTKRETHCTCSICKHSESRQCMQKNVPVAY
jgi:Flp pilus assembly protein TadB